MLRAGFASSPFLAGYAAIAGDDLSMTFAVRRRVRSAARFERLCS